MKDKPIRAIQKTLGEKPEFFYFTKAGTYVRQGDYSSWLIIYIMMPWRQHAPPAQKLSQRNNVVYQ